MRQAFIHTLSLCLQTIYMMPTVSTSLPPSPDPMKRPSKQNVLDEAMQSARLRNLKAKLWSEIWQFGFESAKIELPTTQASSFQNRSSYVNAENKPIYTLWEDAMTESDHCRPRRDSHGWKKFISANFTSVISMNVPVLVDKILAKGWVSYFSSFKVKRGVNYQSQLVLGTATRSFLRSNVP